MRRILIALAALSLMALVGVAASPTALAKTHKNVDPTIYDSTVTPAPTLYSEGFECCQGSELGNQIAFAGTARVLDNVVVQLSSWGCEQGGSPPANPCLTTPGSTFSEPVTLNIYNMGNGLTPGSLIVSNTQDFNIPYRPSENDTDCTGSNLGQWYDSTLDPTTDEPIGCLPDLQTNLTFTFNDVLLPNNVIYGIAYDTSDYGDSPNAPLYQVGGTTPTGTEWGDNTACDTATDSYITPQTYDDCGYDSLNVALNVAAGPQVGTDTAVGGTLYWDSTDGGMYCDGGTDGTGIFRLDSPESGDQCWELGADQYFIPQVQFNAVSNPAATITSADSANVVAGTPFSFTVTTDGVPTPTVTKGLGKIPAGLTFTSNSNGTATISGTALTTDRNRTYSVVIRAVNGQRMRSKQVLTLTLSGGRS